MREFRHIHDLLVLVIWTSGSDVSQNLNTTSNYDMNVAPYKQENCTSPRVAFRTLWTGLQSRSFNEVSGFSGCFFLLFFFPPPPPERGEVLGWSTNEDEHGSPHMDPLKGLWNLAPKHLQQNSLSAMVSAWPTHVQGIYEQIENTGRVESCTETFWRIKFYFFLKKLHTHVQICSTFKTCLSFQTNCVLLSMQDPTAAW